MNTKETINRFRLAYDFLSNFYPVAVCIDGLIYLSSEAAFQAYKCSRAEDRQQFTTLSADEAKRLGRKVELRSDWDRVKLDVMRRVVRAKFEQHPNLARYLVDTGDAELIEGNTWRDTFWGVDIRMGVGENHLGKILMELRQEFKDHGVPQTDTPRQDYLQYESQDGIKVQFRDIAEIECDCIVNATNERLVDMNDKAAIFRAAGPELQEACGKIGGCSVTGVKLTEGYRLPAKHVIHAVSPHYGQKGDAELLALTYRNVLDLAYEQGIHSIAFSAISTGRYSYPKEAATRIGVQTIREWKQEHPDYEMTIFLACVDMGIFNGFRQALEG